MSGAARLPFGAVQVAEHDRLDRHGAAADQPPPATGPRVVSAGRPGYAQCVQVGTSARR